MKANGYEPPLEGYTDDDAFAWVIESIGKVLETAESMGIILGLENHWGLTRTAKGVLRILNAFSSPYIGAVLDVGNFKSQDMYEQMDMIAKYAVLVHAKSYLGGGEWYELDIDYYKVKEILRKHNYDGYISLEYEGKADPHVAVPQELDRLKRILLV